MMTIVFDFGTSQKYDMPQLVSGGILHSLCDDADINLYIKSDSSCSIAYSNAYVVFFDGLLYNKIEICTKQGIREDISNAEVIKNLYEHDFANLKLLQGKFSLVVFNRSRKEITCAVDRFGEKKLCYYIDKGKRIFVASHSKDIARIRNDYSLDKNAIATFFTHNSICAPLTIFEGIKKVEPGSAVLINNFKSSTHKYWDVASYINKEKGNMLKISFEEAQDEFLHNINTSLDMRLNSIPECKIGLLLSGGIDSSILCGMVKAKRITKAYSAAIRDDKNSKLDESDAATIIAKKYNVPIEVVKFDQDQIKKDLIRLQASTDEPMANKSYSVASGLISKAKEDGCNVILTGDGGDELFLGYPRYQRMKKLQLLSQMFIPLSPIICSKIASLIMPQQFVDLIHYAKYSPAGQYKTAIKHEMMLSLYSFEPADVFYEAMNIRNESWFLANNFIDLYYGTQAPIRKWNDITSGLGITHFSPILDEKMLDFSSSLPEEYKMKGNHNKIIMRSILERDLPEISRLPKHGFTVPISKWIRTSFLSDLNRYTESEYIENQGLFHVHGVQKQKELFLQGKSSCQIDTNLFICNYFVLQNWINGVNKNL